MKYLRWIFALLIVTLLASFAAINSNSVFIYYFVGEANIPLAFILLIATLFGVILTLSWVFWYYMSWKLQMSRLKRKLAKHEAEDSII